MSMALQRAATTPVVGNTNTERRYHDIVSFSTKSKPEKRLIEIPKTTLATAKLTQSEWMHIKYGVEKLNELLRQGGDLGKKELRQKLEAIILEVNERPLAQNDRIVFRVDFEHQKGKMPFGTGKEHVTIRVGTAQAPAATPAPPQPQQPQPQPQPTAGPMSTAGKLGGRQSAATIGGPPYAPPQQQATAVPPPARHNSVPVVRPPADLQQMVDPSGHAHAYMNVAPQTAPQPVPMQFPPQQMQQQNRNSYVSGGGSVRSQGQGSMRGRDSSKPWATVQPSDLAYDDISPQAMEEEAADRSRDSTMYMEMAQGGGPPKNPPTMAPYQPKGPPRQESPYDTFHGQAEVGYDTLPARMAGLDMRGPPEGPYDTLGMRATQHPPQPMESAYDTLGQAAAHQPPPSESTYESLGPAAMRGPPPPDMGYDTLGGRPSNRAGGWEGDVPYDSLPPRQLMHDNVMGDMRAHGQPPGPMLVQRQAMGHYPPQQENGMGQRHMQPQQHPTYYNFNPQHRDNPPPGPPRGYVPDDGESLYANQASLRPYGSPEQPIMPAQIADPPRPPSQGGPITVAPSPAPSPAMMDGDIYANFETLRAVEPPVPKPRPQPKPRPPSTYKRPSQAEVVPADTQLQPPALQNVGSNDSGTSRNSWNQGLQATATQPNNDIYANTPFVLQNPPPPMSQAPPPHSVPVRVEPGTPPIQHETSAEAPTPPSPAQPLHTAQPSEPAQPAPQAPAAAVAGSEGEDGPVVMDADTLESCSWFLRLPASLKDPSKQEQRREYMEGLLGGRKDGAWLLRYNDEKGVYIITMRYVNKTLHLTVPQENGEFMLNGKRFPSMLSLLNHFSTNHISNKIATPLTEHVVCCEESDDSNYIML